MGMCLGARPKCRSSINVNETTESSMGSSYDTTIIHWSADETDTSSTNFDPTPSSIIVCTKSSSKKRQSHKGDCKKSSLNRLPDEILVKMLSNLPVLNLVRNRVICKRWNELLSAHTSRGMWAHVSLAQSQESWTMFHDNNHGEAAMYNVVLNRWFALPLNSFIPPEFQIANTTARGLLCVTGHVRGTFVVGMCNPLTNTFRQLPPLLHNRYHADVSAMDDNKTGGYKVLVTGYRVLEMDVTTEVYSSASDGWRVLDNYLNKRKLAKYVHDYPVHQNCSLQGKFYFFTNDSDGGHGSGQIVGFDTTDDMWFSVESPQWFALRKTLYWNPCLLAWNGCLMIAGGAKCSKTCSSQQPGCSNIEIWNGCLTVDARGTKCSRTCSSQPGCSSIQIWKLDLEQEDARGEWVEIASMPAEMFRNFHSQFETFRCFGHGDYVLFMSSSRPQMIVFGLLSGAWSWLHNGLLQPNFAHLRLGLLSWSFKGFSFTPGLHSAP